MRLYLSWTNSIWTVSSHTFLIARLTIFAMWWSSMWNHYTYATKLPWIAFPEQREYIPFTAFVFRSWMESMILDESIFRSDHAPEYCMRLENIVWNLILLLSPQAYNKPYDSWTWIALVFASLTFNVCAMADMNLSSRWSTHMRRSFAKNSTNNILQRSSTCYLWELRLYGAQALVTATFTQLGSKKPFLWLGSCDVFVGQRFVWLDE